MKVQLIDIDSWKPYEFNAKKHPPEQIESLAREMREVGWSQNVVLTHDLQVVVGHGRRLAALRNRELDPDNPAWLKGPARILPKDFPTERIRAMRLYDNRIAETDNDDKMLEHELADLARIPEFEPAWTGYSVAELLDILPDDHEWASDNQEKTDIESDRANEVPSDNENLFGVERGQVWKLGVHRLMCGDSTSNDDVAVLMDGVKAEMTFTSPPYNAGTSAQLSGNTNIDDNLYGEGYDDDKTSEEWLSFVSECTRNALRHSRYIFWNVQMLAGNRDAIAKWWASFAAYSCDVAIWNKGTGIPPQQAPRVMNNQFEFVFIFTSDKDPTRAIRIAPAFQGNLSNVFDIPMQRHNEFASVHAATFPVVLPQTFIEKFTVPGAAVLDLFGGTGTTMIACEGLGRVSYSMEIDPKYCSIIIERYEKFSGRKAEPLNH